MRYIPLLHAHCVLSSSASHGTVVVAELLHAVQSWHADALVELTYVPEAHVVHATGLLCPDLKVPAAHCVQVTPDTENTSCDFK